MYLKFTFLIFGTFLLLNNCLAQTATQNTTQNTNQNPSQGTNQITDFIIIKGRTINAISGEAISYATISNPRLGINTMSNEKGDFLLKIPVTSTGDSLLISHVGFSR